MDIEPLTYRMAKTLMRCRGMFRFSQPAGYNAVRVVVCWHMTKTDGETLGKENGMLEIPLNLYGCPVTIEEPDSMSGYQFALLNPDGTGVAVGGDNKIVHVRMVDGKLAPAYKQESPDET